MAIAIKEATAKNGLRAGDIISVSGGGIVARLMRWLHNADHSHTALVCCPLPGGEYAVMEIVSRGILIRPLSVCHPNGSEVVCVGGAGVPGAGEGNVLAALDRIPRSSYDFEKLLYLCLTLTPRRLFKPASLAAAVARNTASRRISPRGFYQTLCYGVSKTAGFVTFMDWWSSALTLLYRNRWACLTRNIYARTGAAREKGGEKGYEEFVRVVGEEMGKAG